MNIRYLFIILRGQFCCKAHFNAEVKRGLDGFALQSCDSALGAVTTSSLWRGCKAGTSLMGDHSKSDIIRREVCFYVTVIGYTSFRVRECRYISSSYCQPQDRIVSTSLAQCQNLND